jgi:hypothetical protein
VDSWLNRQRGLRRVLLGWLHMSIFTITVGSALWSMFGRGTPGLDIAFLKVVAWSVLAAVPLAGLTAYLRRYLQRARSVATDDRFVFSWRASAAMLLFLAVSELSVLTDQQADWPRIHRAVGLVSLLLIAASFTFVLMAASRYRRHGTRILDDSPSR